MSVKMPKNLEKFTKAEIQEWLDSFDVVLTDCDGKHKFYEKTLRKVGRDFDKNFLKMFKKFKILKFLKIFKI